VTSADCGEYVTFSSDADYCTLNLFTAFRRGENFEQNVEYFENHILHINSRNIDFFAEVIVKNDSTVYSQV
jgi:hypothetical protein